ADLSKSRAQVSKRHSCEMLGPEDSGNVQGADFLCIPDSWMLSVVGLMGSSAWKIRILVDARAFRFRSRRGHSHAGYRYKVMQRLAVVWCEYWSDHCLNGGCASAH